MTLTPPKNIRLERYGERVSCLACSASKDIGKIPDIEEWARAINEFTEQHKDCVPVIASVGNA